MGAVTFHRGRVLTSSLVFFFLSLFLAAYSSKNTWLTDMGSILISEALRPLQGIMKGSARYVGNTWDTYSNLLEVSHENEQLKARLHTLEVENSRLLEWEGEIKRLRSLLGIAEQQGVKGVASDVIGYDASNWVQAVTINRGSSDGVRRGFAVIQGNFVVGQVIAVSPRSSRVLLITDHSSGVDSIVQNSRARGVVEGLGTDLCELNYLSQEEEVTIGDRVVTSGMDGVFPKGLVVGIVTEVQKHGNGMFQSVKVKPSVKFSRLETVLVVTESLHLDTETQGGPKLEKERNAKSKEK